MKFIVYKYKDNVTIAQQWSYIYDGDWLGGDLNAVLIYKDYNFYNDK